MAEPARVLPLRTERARSGAGAAESESSSTAGALGGAVPVGFGPLFEVTWADSPPVVPPGPRRAFGPESNLAADAAEADFRRRLLAALVAQPVEDGMWHPAEDVLRWAVGSFPVEAGRWVSDVHLDLSDKPDVAAGLMQCLARLAFSDVGTWGPRLVKNGLRHRDVAVREATVIAIESWGQPGLLELLRAHREPEAWLADYVEQVLRDYQ